MQLALRATGKPSSPPLVVTMVGEVEPRDLDALAAPRGYEGLSLERVTNRHHSLARMIASGVSQVECARITGYQPAWISTLKTDPAFQELVEFYKNKADEQYVDTHVKLAAISSEAADLIVDRLEEHGSEIPLSELRELVKLGADRTGFGPATKNSSVVDVNVNIADRLEAARKRVAERRVIDGEATRL